MYTLARDYELEVFDLGVDGPPKRIILSPDHPDSAGYVVDIDTGTDIRGSDRDRTQDDGADAGTRYLGTRTIVLRVEIPDADPLRREAKLRRIAGVLAGIRCPIRLSWTTASNKRQFIWVRASAEPKVSHGDSPVKTVAISLVATDPIIYSEHLHDIEALAPNSAGVATTDMINAGDWPAPAQMYVWGPFTSARIQTDSGGLIELLTPVDAGSYVYLDTARRVALLNGAGRYLGLERLDVAWWRVIERTQCVVAFAGAGSGTKVRIRWRDAWSSG